MCKVFERLINNRIIEFIQINNSLINIQCGGRKHRSTVDHLVRLESTIRNDFAHREHFISIFFDLEKAYDMTWRGGILFDLHNMGMRGLLPKYLSSFLQLRRFSVKIKNTVSDIKIQENGIPQGSMLSVTFFAIKINNIIQNLPVDNRIFASLYVDDFQIGYSHPDLSVIAEKLQNILNILTDWTFQNRFKFSIKKTNVVHFSHSTSLVSLPDLYLENHLLPYSNTHRPI